jgi:predicted porin
LVSTGAFAQTNVTISGLFDAGLQWSKGDTGTNQSTNAGYNGTGTSNITFAATEDLGGGMKAGVLLETDIRGAGTMAGFQHYVFVGMNGIGDLSLGQRTNMMTTAAVTVQPFGTAMGGGYASTFNRLRGGGFEAGGAWTATTGRDVRPDGAAHFRSASFSGISFGVDFKPTNNSATETAASSGYLGIGLNYNNGPMNFTFANSKAKNINSVAAVASTVTSAACTAAQLAAGGVTGVGGDYCLTGAVAAVPNADSYVKNTMFGGNYNMGPATVYAGWSKSKADTTAGGALEADSASWNLGLKYTMGNLAFLFNTVKDNDKLAANADRKQTGLGVDYALSKRTTAYARYVTLDTDTNTSNAGKMTTTALGLKHSF